MPQERDTLLLRIRILYAMYKEEKIEKVIDR